MSKPAQITEGLLERICERAYAEGARATRMEPWEEVPERGRQQVRDMVKDVLVAYFEVTDAPISVNSGRVIGMSGAGPRQIGGGS